MVNNLVKVAILLAVVVACLVCVQGRSRGARSKGSKSGSGSGESDTCAAAFWDGQSCQQPGVDSSGSNSGKHGRRRRHKSSSSSSSSEEDGPPCDYCSEHRLVCKPACKAYTDDTGAVSNVLTSMCPSGCCRDEGNCWDIDECASAKPPCFGGQCVNTAGSYECTCDDGYRYDAVNMQCDDIDECTEGTPCGSNSQCSNSPEGTYTCVCDAGYKLDSSGACSDMDECTLISSVCGPYATCANNPPGSFTCTCEAGYEKNSDGVCEDKDECADGKDNDCDEEIADCTNTIGSYTCTCKSGTVDISKDGDASTCAGYVCEHETFSLSCDSGDVISIESAVYGRNHGPEICPHDKIQTTTCAATTSLAEVQECDGNHSCSIMASNSVFGDPCKNTFKYLVIQYSCINGEP